MYKSRGGTLEVSLSSRGSSLNCTVVGCGFFGGCVEGVCSSLVKSLKLNCSREKALKEQAEGFRDGVRKGREGRKMKRAKRTEEIEGMEEGRKRRWKREFDKRGNRGSNWRPSGKRQQSPNNC